MPSLPDANADTSPPPGNAGPAIPRGFFGLVMAAIVLALLYFGRELFIPFSLAVLFSFVLDPLVARLRKLRLPRAPAVALVMLCAVAVVGATSFFVASQAVQLARDLPTYQTTIQTKLRVLRAEITGRGVLEDASRMISAVSAELDATRRALDSASRTARPPAARVQIEAAPGSPMQAIGDVLAPLLGPVATTGLVLVFTTIILLQRNDLRDRLLRLAGGELHRTTDALDEAAHRVSRYLTMQLLVNTTFAAPMALGLWAIGVPGALLWGLMAGAFRFVPYVGPVIAAAFPLLMAFAVDPGWQMLLWTLLLIGSLELLINNFIEPWLYSASTGLAPVALLVSAALWTALWGPIGLILATPITVCLVVMGRHLPALAYLDLLFGRDPVFDAPTKLYQRLLAGDVEEAIELSAEQASASTLRDFYGDTAIPALRLAAGDHARVARAEHRHRVVSGMAALIRDLREEYRPATAASAGTTSPVLCIGARWEVDTLAAEMLAHALAVEGLDSRHLPPSAVAPENIFALDLQGVQVICLSYFSATSQAHARYVCRRLRRLWPDLHIVLAMWNAPPALLLPDAALALGADAMATSFVEAVLRVQALLAPASEQATAAAPLSADEFAHEARRLQALADSGALAAEQRAPLDRTAQRVAEIFDAPWAMVSLVDRESQRWHGAAGLGHAAGEEARRADRSTSLCAHVVATDAPMQVPDIARDPRFAGHAALQAAGMRFYAGVPLHTASGMAIGSLCIFDRNPRTLGPSEMKLLQAMADDVMAALAATSPTASTAIEAAVQAEPQAAGPLLGTAT